MAIILKPRFLIRALRFNGMKHSHLYYCYTWVPTFFYHILFINLILISPILSLTMIFVQKPIIYIHDIYKCPEIGKMFSDETTLNNILYLTLCPLIRQSHDWLIQHFFFHFKNKINSTSLVLHGNFKILPVWKMNSLSFSILQFRDNKPKKTRLLMYAKLSNRKKIWYFLLYSIFFIYLFQFQLFH